MPAHGLWFTLLCGISRAYVLLIENDREYQNKTINCPSGEDCSVTCDASYSCAGATFNCATDHLCHIHCGNQPKSCHGAIFNCDNSEQCDIRCESETDHVNACDNTVVHCPEGSCNVSCEGRYVCRSMYFDVPVGGHLNAFCIGGQVPAAYTCAFATFKCPGNSQSNECSVTGCDDGYRVCYNKEWIYVPTLAPTQNTFNPSASTSNPTTNPTNIPSVSPLTITTFDPTGKPTNIPSKQPTLMSSENIINTQYESTYSQRNKQDIASMNVIVVSLAILILFLCIAILCMWRLCLKRRRKKIDADTRQMVDEDNKVKDDTLPKIQLQSSEDKDEAVDHNTNEMNIQYNSNEDAYDDEDASILKGISETVMGDNNQNEKNIAYNMNAEGDAIVIGDDEITSGNDLEQTNYHTNDLEQSGNDLVGADELISEPEGMNVEQCVDCGAVKEGKTYDDGLFYCTQCYDNYD